MLKSLNNSWIAVSASDQARSSLCWLIAILNHIQNALKPSEIMGKFCWVKTIFSLPFHSQQSPKRQIFTIGIIKCLNFWNFRRKHKSQTVTFATAQKCIKHCSFQLAHLLSFADYLVKRISQLRTWYQSFDVRQCRLHKNSCRISNIIKTECHNEIQAWDRVAAPPDCRWCE